MVVRPLARGDVEATAALQASAPASGALDVPAALGAGYLERRRLAHLDSPRAVALVAEQVDDDGDPLHGSRTAGVLLAVLDHQAHREHLRREHGPGRATGLAGASLRSPRALTGGARHRVGRQLLASLAAHAAGAGLARVEARVPWGTGAEGFFAACGWTASTPPPERPRRLRDRLPPTPLTTSLDVEVISGLDV